MPRLPEPRFAPDCTIDVDGEPVPARRGESVAVALLAAGHVVLGRSPKYHRPRGPFCLAGSCHGCLARIDGLPGQRACRVPCRPGLVVASQNAFPSAQHDLLSAFDHLYPRGLDHHHLMTRNAFLNRAAVAVSRLLTGQGRLPDRPASPASPPAQEHREALVVGAGPAGLGAALALALAGRRVLLAESDTLPGGRLRSGLGRAADPPLDWAEGAVRAVTSAGGEVAFATTALGVWHDGESPLVALRAEDGPRLRLVRVDRLVLATGTHAVPPLLPRNDLPGILAARGLARALREDGLVPGRRAVVLGRGGEAQALAERLSAAGLEVRPARMLSAVRGGRRVRSVLLPHGERVACDTLVFAGPRAPAAELARQAGAPLAFDPEGQAFRVLASPHGATGQAGLWVAGEITSPMTAEEAAEAGRLAGEAAHVHG